MSRPPVVAALAALVIARFAFHAFYVPVFEGPDEPFHLGRILAFRDVPFRQGFRGEPLSPAIVSAVEAHPCGPDLRRAFGCRLFDGRRAVFNVLEHVTSRLPTRAVENYENQQPPLYYLVCGLAHRLISSSSGEAQDRVERDLLLFRLLSVALISAALLWPCRVISASWSGDFQIAVLIALLLPGAVEALARCSNDPAVFLWSAAVVLALRKNASAGLILALLALGPLLKLTAFPVVVMAVVCLWKQRGRLLAFMAMLASLLVVPVQLFRGWHGGGTYDVGRGLLDLDGSAVAMLRGLFRSAYTIVKTVFWVGGWSFFRAPQPLVLGWFLLLFLVLLSLQVRRDWRRIVPHALGALTVTAGVLVVAIANRRIFADWGGVGGWYFWSWFPWLAVAAVEAFQISRRTGRKLLALEATFVVAANVLYFAVAFKTYG